MKLIIIILAFFLLCPALYSSPPDTFNIVYYNLWKYPGKSAVRWKELKKITSVLHPEMLNVCEIFHEDATNLLLDSALNTTANHHYSRAGYMNGFDTDNMSFYQSKIFRLLQQDTVATGLRPITYYRYQYLPDTSVGPLHVIIAHLKAGPENADAAERAKSIGKLVEYIRAKHIHQNIVLGGDLNFYSSGEEAYQLITSNEGLGLTDPGIPGKWHDNVDFTRFHTQSTHKSNTGGYAAGGLDDRFDFIFVSPGIMDLNSCSVCFKRFQVFGNDGSGKNFDQSILFSENRLYPDTVMKALYAMSDHLPVILTMFSRNTQERKNVSPLPSIISIKKTYDEGLYSIKPGSILLTGLKSVRIKSIMGTIYEITEDIENSGFPGRGLVLNPGIYFIEIETLRGKQSFCFFL